MADMVKLKFKAGRLRQYSAPGYRMADGDIAEFTPGDATRLLTDFPDMFSEVKPKVKDDSPKPKSGWKKAKVNNGS